MYFSPKVRENYSWELLGIMREDIVDKGGGLPTIISQVQLRQLVNSAKCKIFACRAAIFTGEPENIAYHVLKTSLIAMFDPPRPGFFEE